MWPDTQRMSIIKSARAFSANEIHPQLTWPRQQLDFAWDNHPMDVVKPCLLATEPNRTSGSDRGQTLLGLWAADQTQTERRRRSRRRAPPPGSAWRRPQRRSAGRHSHRLGGSMVERPVAAWWIPQDRGIHFKEVMVICEDHEYSCTSPASAPL